MISPTSSQKSVAIAVAHGDTSTGTRRTPAPGSPPRLASAFASALPIKLDVRPYRTHRFTTRPSIRNHSTKEAPSYWKYRDVGADELRSKVELTASSAA